MELNTEESSEFRETKEGLLSLVSKIQSLSYRPLYLI